MPSFESGPEAYLPALEAYQAAYRAEDGAAACSLLHPVYAEDLRHEKQEAGQAPQAPQAPLRPERLPPLRPPRPVAR